MFEKPDNTFTYLHAYKRTWYSLACSFLTWIHKVLFTRGWQILTGFKKSNILEQHKAENDSGQLRALKTS